MQQGQGLKSASIAALLAISLIGSPAALVPIEGRWSIDARHGGDQVEISLKRSWNEGGSHGTWSFTNDFDRSDLPGLPARRSADGPVSIKIVRESGTIRLEGQMNDGLGSGRFTFESNASFVADLKRAGFRDLSENDLFRVCAHDLSRAWIQDVRSLRLQEVTLDGLLRLDSHGVTPDFVRALAASGYSGLSVDEVVRLQSHGVTADYVRGLGASAKKKPTVDEIVRFKAHGLEPAYVSKLSGSFEPEEMIRLHVHGVSADYVREFRALGYQSASAEDLVRLRNHGVSPEFARRAQTFHGKVTTDELIRLKVNGVE